MYVCMAWYLLPCSVRLSVTCVYCVETTELIIKQLALDCSLGDFSVQTPNVERISLRDAPHLERYIGEEC